MQLKTVVSLVSTEAELLNGEYNKAGVVPFVRGGGAIRYYFMKPVAKNPDKARPDFQICKGTRMGLHAARGWIDLKDNKEHAGEREPLIVTALREGIEELGLKLDAVGAVFDVGPYRFSSERTGNSKRMWLFALEMASMEEVLPMAEVDSGTAERGWMTLAEFAIVGRADHRYIMRDIERKISAQ